MSADSEYTPGTGGEEDQAGASPPTPGDELPPEPTGPLMAPHYSAETAEADSDLLDADEPAAARSGSPMGAVIIVSILVALVVSLVAGMAGGILGVKLGATLQGAGSLRPANVTVLPSKTDEPAVAAAAAAVPSVVNIDVSSGEPSGDRSGLPQDHPSVPSQGNGSGVVYKKAPGGGTYIVTNNHVVENAKSIRVKDPGGQSWKAKLIGRDPETDIAVVEISGQLPPIKLGNSERAAVGQTVVAIGSPFGLEHSVTSGIISAIGRSLPDFSTTDPGTYPLVDVIQTDAAINPGNSGGALVDRAGDLIGINTAIYSESGASGGIGFAIPVNTAARAADALIESGKVEHPFIGVIGLSMTPEIAAERGLSVKEGAIVEDFSKGSTAERAGLKSGDVIVELNGEKIRSMDDLILQVRRTRVGTTVKVTVVRGTGRKTLDVVIGEKPATIETTSPSPDTSVP